MLWNEIYKFFVINVFGGYIYGNSYGGLLGVAINDSDLIRYISTDNCTIALPFHLTGINESLYMPIGNYLSFVATLISIIIIVILCCLFIKKIVSLMGKLFSGGTL